MLFAGTTTPDLLCCPCAISFPDGGFDVDTELDLAPTLIDCSHNFFLSKAEGLRPADFLKMENFNFFMVIMMYDKRSSGTKHGMDLHFFVLMCMWKTEKQCARVSRDDQRSLF